MGKTKICVNFVTKLQGIPSHQGIEGNEIADQLAKNGAATSLIGPEPHCGLSKSHLLAEVRMWENVKFRVAGGISKGSDKQKN